MRKIILCFTLLICLSSCATAQRLNRINVGMNKQEVITRLGNPDSTKAQGGMEVLEYMLYPVNPWTQFGPMPPLLQYWIVLQDGKVVQYGKAGDFDTLILPALRQQLDANINVHHSSS